MTSQIKQRHSNLQKDSKIFVAGHKGLVGNAIVKSLHEQGFQNILTHTKDELDLSNLVCVENFFALHQPEFVFLAAAKVGGILANTTYRADFIYQNLAIQNNVIFSAYKYQVKKLIFLGSSCIYPKETRQPIKEDYLLTSPLEYTNEPYAIAKIAGMKMCESFNLQYGTNFLCLMPTNLYGSNDNFNLFHSHVIPALIRKMHLAKLLSQGNTQAALQDVRRDCAQTAKEAQNILDTLLISDKAVGVWGSGKPRREFLHSSDMANASIHIMQHVDFADILSLKKLNVADSEIRNTHINVGYGSDVSIQELAELIKRIVGFEGEILYDSSKPDGTMQKLMDSSMLESLGFIPQVSLEDGLKQMYEDYCRRFPIC
ncbi:GDP-L-fucose synthase [Helicobacter aurati]|uniref:GDP-L-fucose synthase n=1 Tax=Helicobacter aurati TaxID=137778 RepID=A0A3D8J842_9HELI|nr:GDP-L-fucose synthase [Helicobacter aurati]RDU73440.1 GDP-L-fucose synthase [Helicobacter aurati]